MRSNQGLRLSTVTMLVCLLSAVRPENAWAQSKAFRRVDSTAGTRAVVLTPIVPLSKTDQRAQDSAAI
jgi:hypothetical protein